MKEKSAEELAEEEEEEDSTEGGSSPSSPIVPLPGNASKRSSRLVLDDLRFVTSAVIDDGRSSRSSSEKRRWRTSLRPKLGLGKRCKVLALENDMHPVLDRLVRPLVAEFLGTFLLTFVGVCVSCKQGASADAGPVSTGLTVALVIMMFGPVSGAHINPCVSLAFALTGHLTLLKLPCYILAQIAGSSVAGLLARLLLSPSSYLSGFAGLVLIPNGVSVSTAIIAEAVATFFLIMVVLHVAVDQSSYLMAPVAIGFVVIVNIFSLGDVSGCCMNPARSIGASIAATGLQNGDHSNSVDSINSNIIDSNSINSNIINSNSINSMDNSSSIDTNALLQRSWMDNLWFVLGTGLGTIVAAAVFRILTSTQPSMGLSCLSAKSETLPDQPDLSQTGLHQSDLHHLQLLQNPDLQQQPVVRQHSQHAGLTQQHSDLLQQQQLPQQTIMFNSRQIDC